jgi:cytochrome oxidase Cu insertion factor (SCO1/SenC/PrrC family)
VEPRPDGGPFVLIDHTGTPRTDQDFRGKLLLIYFGYSYCPDVCPTDLQQIALATDVGFGGRSGNLVLDRSTTGFDPDQSLRH